MEFKAEDPWKKIYDQLKINEPPECTLELLYQNVIVTP